MIPEEELRKERVDFFEFALGAYQRAERLAGGHDWFGELAGRKIHLRGAGQHLLHRLTPALAHIQSKPGIGDLTIHLFDNSQTGPLPALLKSFIADIKRDLWQNLDPRHSLRHLNDKRFRAVYRLGADLDILSLYDSHTGRAIYWMEDASLLPYWELSSPFQMILNWWAQGQGFQYVHAAAVGTPQGAVLLTGPGGSGKSSTALACLGSQLSYLSDDYCLMSAHPPRVQSLYCTAKLVGEPDLERFPHLRPWVLNPKRQADEKILLNLFERCPHHLLLEAPLQAVVVPRVVPGLNSSRLTRLRGAQALLALAPSTLFQLAGVHQECMSQMAQLLRQVPCYQLELGAAGESLPGLLGGLLPP